MHLFIKLFLFVVFNFGILISNAQSRVQELAATQYQKNVIVNFIVTAGNSCTGYQILKSTDSLNFNVIYDYAGVCGESSKPQSFLFTDEFPEKNKKNYYQILIQPADYSTISSVFYTDVSEKGYILLENPISNDFKVIGSSITKKLIIYNQTGNLVLTILPNEDAQYHQDISILNSGLYYFIIETTIGNSLHGKFIKK